MFGITKSAVERALRTAGQTTAAVAVAELLKDGASWITVPQAASIGAFAGFIALLMAVAGPTAPRQG
jgi:hypothetical protein